ncbi:hypothetical protein [Kitasatospora indigofera]|uniref:hypothetical protein n=1 Tax=Kitasatospora indigofera TaxID=67307 RepID=UPI0036836CE4
MTTQQQEYLINTVIRRTVRTTLVAATCSTVLAAGLAACGTVQQLSAAQKVSDAFGKLGDSKSFSAKLSVDATAAQIEAFGAATGDKIGADSAAALSTVSLAVSLSADKPLKDLQSPKGADGKPADPDALLGDKALSFSYALTGKGGKSLLELRQVGGKTFAQADLAGFATLVGEDPSEVREMTADLPASVRGALAGKWVSLDAGTLQDFSKSLRGGRGAAGGKAGATPSAPPTLAPGTEENLLKSLKDVFSRDVSFEDKGKQDGKDRVTVSVPSRKLAEDLLKAFQPLAEEIPNLGKLPTAVPSDLPDRKLAMDVLLDHGALSAVTFDLAQLDEKIAPGTSLPIKIAFGKDVPAVQAPAGATEITKADLDSLFGEISGGGRGGLGGDLGGPAEPLTDAQVKELTQGGGLTEQQVRTYNKLGLSFEEIKELAVARV